MCGSDQLSEFCKCFDHLTTQETFSISSCNDCGFKFTNPYPSIDDIHLFYESDEYVPVSNTTKGLINKFYHLARRVMLYAKRRLVYKLTGSTSGRCLDIGCGTGDFIGYMKQSGWEVQGVEPHDKARMSAQERFGVQVVDISEQADLPDKFYNVVTLWHVLEHAHDVNRSMREIDRLLAEGGTVLIGVPNNTSYDASFYGSKWAGYDVPHHLYHFNPDVMSVLALKHGFKVEAMKSLLFDPLYMSLLTEKERDDRSWLRGLMVATISMSYGLFHPTRCSSMIYILRRKMGKS